MRTPAFSRLVSASAALALLIPMGGLSAFVQTASAADVAPCIRAVYNSVTGGTDYVQDPNCVAPDDYTASTNQGVFVSITDGQDTINAGGSVTYIITLKQQRAAVQLVDLNLRLSDLGTIVSASDDGTLANGGVNWTKVAVFNGQTRTLTVHAVVNPNSTQGQLLVAKVDGGGTTATDTTMIGGRAIPYPQNQLQVSVTDNRDYALPGDTLNYVVAVHNPEPNAAVVHVRVGIPVALHVSNAPGSTSVNGEIVWENVTVNPHQTLVYTFTAIVDARVPNHYPIQVVVRAGNVVASDRTIVGSGNGGPYSLFPSITDNRDTANRGDLLTYAIHIDNSSGRLEPDASITAALPIHGEFVDATEGGYWDGKNVRWQHLQVAPGSSRDISFTVRVRNDAPDGTQLRGSVTVQGYTATDVTQVGGGPVSYNSSYVSNAPSNTYGNLAVQKISSTSAATAGSAVTYTVAVRNTDGVPLQGVVVADSFDPSALTVTDTGAGQTENGKIVWTVDTLQPGEVRTFSYTGLLAKNLPAGSSVLNTAQAFTSSSIGYTPTATSNVSVLMPQTGIEDFFGAVENPSQFLIPVSAAEQGSALPMLFWLGLIAGGLVMGGKIGKKLEI